MENLRFLGGSVGQPQEVGEGGETERERVEGLSG
jgi:hypothetical protein